MLKRIWTIGLIVGIGAPLAAQDKPAFEYKEKAKEETKGTEWTAKAQAGLVVASGNAQSVAATAAFDATRKSGFNQLALNAGLNYLKSSIWIVQDVNGDGMVQASEETFDSQVTSEHYYGALRYDRFLSDINSVFVTGKIAKNEPAGKKWFGGGQLGYSHLLYNKDGHKLTSEAGYDYTYESYVAGGDALNIHSARLYLGYEGKLSDDTGVKTTHEGLLNFNELSAPNGTIDPFQDFRYTGTLELNTKMYKNVSFSFGFQVNYDHAPAPRPAIGGLPFAAGYLPLADKVDTVTKATLIVTFI